MEITIEAERPDTGAARLLIAELEAVLEPLYPKASRHGYSIEKLLREQVAFFVLRNNGEPAGCGGVQFFGAEYAELKRMYVRPAFRGLGFGRLLLEHLSAYTLENGIILLRLETGIHQVEAIHLYERVGFRPIPPFGEYREDPLSRFYEKRLSSIDAG
jgi:GNAT superfamily N-acetyltransferase